MIMNNEQNQEIDDSAARNAISLYGQDGMDDFPVLKAFQQYVDAEQSKARKRMVYLAIFFGALMAIMLTIFLVIMSVMGQRNQELTNRLNERNQALNDRLLELALKDRDKVSNPQQEASLKAMTEAMASMQKQLIEQQTKAASELAIANARVAQIEAEARASARAAEIEAKAKAAINAAEAKAAAAEAKAKEMSDGGDAALMKVAGNDSQTARALAKLKAEQDKLAAEKERFRQQEKEYHLRRYYPEYYAKKDAEEGRTPSPLPIRDVKQTATPLNGKAKVLDDVDDDDDDDDDLDALLDDLPDGEPEKTAPKHDSRPSTATKPLATTKKAVPVLAKPQPKTNLPKPLPKMPTSSAVVKPKVAPVVKPTDTPSDKKPEVKPTSKETASVKAVAGPEFVGPVAPLTVVTKKPVAPPKVEPAPMAVAAVEPVRQPEAVEPPMKKSPLAAIESEPVAPPKVEPAPMAVAAVEPVRQPDVFEPTKLDAQSFERMSTIRETVTGLSIPLD